IPEKAPPRTNVVNGDRARRDGQDLDLEGVARARALDGDGAGRRGQHPRLLPWVPGPLVRIPRLHDQLFAGADGDRRRELRIQYRRERVAAETLHRLLTTLVTDSLPHRGALGVQPDPIDELDGAACGIPLRLQTRRARDTRGFARRQIDDPGD